ncbi:hypothetical protein SNEBB_003802 [Seison nebaliae]|nr:hypothetical protein SNEBB_003802 [Seison nebaliae]
MYDSQRNLMDTANNGKRMANIFSILVVIAEVFGSLAIVLVSFWIWKYRGGLAGRSDLTREFNYHPLFMTIGLIFFYGNSILLFRVFRNMKKTHIKIIHATLHMAAFIFSIVGLVAVFDTHNLKEPPIPNMYTLHSWIGMTTIILFTLQWMSGFVAFLFPKLSDTLRTALMPKHRFWGVAIFILSCLSALLGIMEKVTFISASIKYNEMSGEGVLINIYGMCIVFFGLIVSYVVTKDKKRLKTN